MFLVAASAMALTLGACRRVPATGAPSVDITTTPQAAVGGSDRQAGIAGRVVGAKPDQRIVIYAKSGLWWVQPYAAEPFTAIARDGSWSAKTHLGDQYAALLVGPAYQPPATLEALPEPDADIIALATSKGQGTIVEPPHKTMAFSGYEWDVRQIPSNRGGSNEYDPANAFTDADGALHLKLTQRNGTWYSAEIVLTRQLGYGTYVFVVRDVSQLDPAAVLGLFTWDDGGADQSHREMDVEISQWGDRSVANAQYVVQPYYVPENVARFQAPAGRLTHTFRWEPGRVSFSSFRGETAAGHPIAQHEFTAGVPSPATEHVRMNLYDFRYATTPLQREAEVVIERFQYLP
jgi:hypothetical protein